MRFFKRGETVDTKFVFLDSATNEPIDVTNATYRIVHYDNAAEVIDVAESALTSVTGRVGHYIVNWDVPMNVPEFETYFVYATGTHVSDGTITQIEDFFRVVPADFFTGGSGGGAGLTIKFTKP